MPIFPCIPAPAAVYNGTQQSFMDEYGNWIYLTPMVLGGSRHRAGRAVSGRPATGQGPLDSLYAMARRIRKAGTEAELSEIEDEIDGILNTQRARSATGDENAIDDTTLNVAAHRLESLIHDRRTVLAMGPTIVPDGPQS